MNRKNRCLYYLCNRDLCKGGRGLLLVGVLAICGTLLLAQAPTGQNPASSEAANANQQNQSTQPATADQQQNDPSDRQITKQIRVAIVADKTLSAYAHQVTVVTQDGTVTLRGTVLSEQEKRIIEEKAAEIAGEINVISELSVRQKSSGI